MNKNNTFAETADPLKNVPILHINTAGTWRGGEKQTFYLVSVLNRQGYNALCVCQKDSPLYHKLLERRLPCLPLKMRSEFDIAAAWRISLLARKTGTGIMHMHTAHAHSLGFISSMFFRVPVNIVSRRVDFRLKKNILSRLKYKYPEGYITVSNAIRNILIEDGIPAEKITAVYSGVDFEVYKDIDGAYPGKEFSISKKKVKFVNVAALTDQKDHETLLRAAGILKNKFRDFILIIAGEGELKAGLLKLREQLSLEEHVVFAGFREDALNFIAFGDIFIMSSRWEGLGTSIIDAMALRKPVIATNTGGIPELITNNRNGKLAAKENPQALADAMFELASDRKLRKRLGDRAFKDAHDFSIGKTVEETIRIYRELYAGYL